LERTSNVIQNAFKKDMKDGNTTQDDPAAESWSAVSSTLMDCKIALARMTAALVRVTGESGSSRHDRFKRHFRRLAQDEEMSDLRQRLNKGHQRLQFLLSTLNMLVSLYHRTRRIADINKPCHTSIKLQSFCTDGKSGTASPINRWRLESRCTHTSRGKCTFHDSTVSQQFVCRT